MNIFNNYGMSLFTCHLMFMINIYTYSGTSGGLYMMINVEQYQYTFGPNNAIGLRIAMRSQHHHRSIDQQSISIPVGMHTFISLDYKKVIDILQYIIYMTNNVLYNNFISIASIVYLLYHCIFVVYQFKFNLNIYVRLNCFVIIASILYNFIIIV